MDKNSKEYQEALIEFYKQLDKFFEKEIDEDIYEPIKKFSIDSTDLFKGENQTK